MSAKKTAVSDSAMVPSTQYVSVAWKIIAKAIVDRFPPEARCLLNKAYVEAKIAAGYDNWEVVLVRDKEILCKACLCPHHQQQPTAQQQPVP